MASPRLAKSFQSKRRRKEEAERKRKVEKRRLHHELLEDRRLMAQGPSLVSVIPTSGVFLHNGDTLNVAPRDITFRFAQGNSIDASTLATGFVVRSAGNDHILGDTDDQTVTPGFLGLGDSPREVIMRFASTLPDNVYSVTLVGSGATPLKDTGGNVFSSGNPASPDLTLNFTLDLGAKVDAIVPQPISRDAVTNVLSQNKNSIVVYFDQQMSTTDVVKPSFYHLVDATASNNAAITLPSSVTYSDNATLTIQNIGATLLSYNGVSATSPLIVTDQVSRVTITNAGTNNTGTFTLTVNGSTTSTIPAFGATPAMVLAALNAIPTLNGNVAVAAAPPPVVPPGGTPPVEQFDITFQGALTGRVATVAMTTQGVGTTGNVATQQAASNLTAAAIQTNLNTISALNGKVTVTGANGGPFNVAFTGSLAGTNTSLVANNVPTASIGSTIQTLSLVANGAATLSFNGVNATAPLTVLTGSAGTTAGQVTTNLNTIAALAGKIAVLGPAGGPFTISVNTLPTGAGGSLIVSSDSTIATTVVTSQTLTLVSNGISTLSFGGVSATSPLTVVTGPAGTLATDVQANLNTIPSLAGNVTVTGNQGGPFTIAFTGAAAAANISLKATSPAAVVAITSQQPIATLNFANPIPAGTFRLEIGTTPEPTTIESIQNANYQHVGNSMTTPIQAFIGDSLTAGTAAAQVNDVDLYRFDVQNLTNLNVTVTPSASLDAVIRVFDKNGAAVGTPINAGGAGVTEIVAGSTIQLNPLNSPYYVGISSAGNVNYNASTGASASGGTTTGGYSLKVTFTDLPTSTQTLHIVSNDVNTTDLTQLTYLTYNGVTGSLPLDPITGPAGTNAFSVLAALNSIPALAGIVSVTGPTGGPFNITFPGSPATTVFLPIGSTTPNVAITLNDDRAIAPGNTNNVDNSSFGGASPTGVLGPAGRSIAGAIMPTPDPSQIYLINFPGSGDAPGDRQVPYLQESYIQTPVGDAPDPTAGVETITYDFQNFYGYDPQGNVLQNAITENQKQRTREIFELLSRTTGMQFREVDPNEDGSVLADMTIVTGDIRAIAVLGSPLNDVVGFPVIPTSQAGNPQNVLINHQFVIMNAGVNWGVSGYGGTWFINAMQGITRSTGVVQHRDTPDLTPQNLNSNTEHVFPTPADVVSEQALHRPESNDIDVYSFTTTDPGLYRAETIAERLPTSTPYNPNLLNTVLTLYKETTDSTGNKIRTEIARNDDYYGNDSYLELHLDPGTYYVAVTSTGNTQFDPTIPDTGMGGRTQGAYSLSMSLKPDTGITTMKDATGIAFDGDGDGTPGGANQFWFQSNTANNTIYVDKASTVAGTQDGSLAHPYTKLDTALAAAGSSLTKKIVRIIGNGGTDGDPNTLRDDQPYLVGFKDPGLTQPLADGGTFQVPMGVTVMIDAGAVIKMRRANLNAGTTPQGVVSKAGSSIQVLGTPLTQVQITSYSDDTIGGDSNPSEGPALLPQGGDFGGVVFRDDSDHERDWQNAAGSAANPLGLAMPVFLNYVNHATINYGGGKVTVDSVQDVYDPLYMDKARPTLTYNTIQSSANAAMSASPNTFDDDGLPNITAGGGKLVPFDQRRIGPDIHDNTVGTNDPTKQQLNNTIDGLFIRIRTDAGSPLDLVDSTTRWKATDIVYVVSENLLIAGTPGGSIEPGVASPTGGNAPLKTMIEDGRLRIDAGVTVKMSARIETKFSSQFIAEGTTSLPIIFTSLKDDRYGAGGSFDTNKDGNQTAAAPGQWGGFYFGPASVASLDHVGIYYGGGTVPIEGGFDNFNAVESNQADLRLTNSVLQFNAGGGAAPSDDRNGRGTNDDAVIFVRGAQPIIVGNVIRDNNTDASGLINATGPVISINANAMVSTVQGDYGRSTGTIDRFTTFDDNHGPLVRVNRLSNNTTNGMQVRGETLTTETIWDDTDIAHIVQDEVTADNLHVYGGLRLQSSTSASLVVKLTGSSAGLSATGTPLDINNRIGGTVQIIGQPGHPVVLTAIDDDTASAGFDPSGFPLFDTNNDGQATNFLGTLPNFPPATGPLAVAYNTNATQLQQAITLRPLPGGVTISNATYTGSTIAAGTYTNGDNVPLGIPPQGIILSTGDAKVPVSNTQTGFTGTNSTLPGDTDLTALINRNNTGTQFQTFDAANLTLTIDVAPGSGIQSGAFDFQFGSEEYNEFVGSPFNDVFGGFINGGAGTNFVHDSRGNLVNINSGFFNINNLNGQLKIEYDGLTSGLTARFPLHAGTNVLKLAIADAGDPILDSGVFITDLRFSPQNVGNGGVAAAPGPGEWRSIKLDKNSNDTNVAEILESEPAYVGSDLSLDNDRTPQLAQVLGSMAPNDKSGDDNRRLGFQLDGNIAMDNSSDVDVYSFNADSGTEVWFDVDNTSPGLNAMIELVDADGNVLASATDTDPNNAVVTPVAPPTILSVPAGQASANTQQVKLSTPAGTAPYVFYLTFNGQKTGPIASNAKASDVQAAISSLSGLPLVAGTSVTGNAGGPWNIAFTAAIPLLGTPGGFLRGTGPNVDPAIPTLPGLNQNVTAAVLAGGVGLAQSFDKDHFNGRDTFSTNPGSVVAVDSGVIITASFPATAINNGFPVQIASTSHGLATGDRVQISGVSNNPNANGVFTVTVQDPDHFTLDGSSGGFAGTGGTWTKLVQTTRDPQMRVVLPKAANGTDLKNSPWFIRVRSEPATFAGEAGNTLNPGLTSGQYQLQVRIQQQDQKPASTVRFSDIRYATNGIEVHGLPQHTPLAGETAEADTASGSAGNDVQTSSQFLGNLLTTDQSTISVGGQIANINDVDWYQFDLNADLTTFYSSSFNTFATMFDLDYAAGLARPDMSISVFDQTGALIYVSNGSNNKADQPAPGQGLNADDLSRGSFNPLDPSIGPVQLPAGKTGSRTRTYYVAVSTSRQVPTSLNQQFLSAPSDQLVRVEPVDSIGRIVQDTLDQSGGATAVLPENQYNSTSNTGVTTTKSTFLDLTDKQTLSANVVPFSLSDVSLFVSQRTTGNRTILQVANPSTGVIDLSNIGTIDAGNLESDDITMRGDGTLWGYQTDGTPGNTTHAGNIIQIDPSNATNTLLGPDNIAFPTGAPPNPPTIQSVNMLSSGFAQAIAWGGTSVNPINNSRQEPLYLAVDDFSTFFGGPGGGFGNGGVSALYSADFTNGNAFVTQNRIPPGRVFGGNLTNPLDLTNATRPTTSTDFGLPGLLVKFQDTSFGSTGNGRNINFVEDPNLAVGAPPVVTLDPTTNDVNVTFNPNGRLATTAKTFGNNQNGEIDFTAQKLGSGTQANPITVQFTQVASLSGNKKVSVNVTGNAITVLLSQANHATAIEVVNEINQNANANALVVANTNGLQNLDVITPAGGGQSIDQAQPNPMVLSDGATPTTVTDLVGAINANSALNLNATFLPANQSGAIIGDEITRLTNAGQIPVTQLTLGGGSGQTGFTTGLAFGADAATLYGVTDRGLFYKVDIDVRTGVHATKAKDLNGNPALIFPPVQVTVPGLAGNISFAGLARGPLDLNNGEFANDFFAITQGGDLVCIDTSGNALPVFDSNGDGTADAYTVALRTFNNGAPVFPTGFFTGLAFSNLDFNLWHPTNSRDADAGHNITSPANTPDLNFGRVPATANNNTSFYFGFENTGQGAALGPFGQVGSPSGTTATVAGAVSDFTETGTLANNTSFDISIVDPSGITPAITPANQFAIDPNDPNWNNAYAGNQLFITLQGAVTGTFQIAGYNSTNGVITVTPNFPANSTPTPGDTFHVNFASTTQFVVSPLQNNNIVGKFLVFTPPSPNAAFGTDQIQAFDPTTNTITLAQALPSIPNDGDGFRIQNAAPATRTQFDASGAGLSNVNDFYSGDVLTFDATTLTPSLQNRSFTILQYLGPSHTFIFGQQMPAIPQDQSAVGGGSDTFTIIHTTQTAAPEQIKDGGQYGILGRDTIYTGSTGLPGAPSLPRTRTADELLNNPLLPNSYNFPGGAYGKLQTGQFSLKGIAAGDLPTFYFDYFLDVDDANSTLQAHNMVDSARVFIGPFTRLNGNIAPTVPSAFVAGSPSPAPTATQFSAFSGFALSNVDGFYNGQALQFTNGMLAGQAKVISNYIGATHTFIFADAFPVAPSAFDNFQVGTAVVTWDELATNNGHLDDSTTPAIDGELPTFLSQQTSEFPNNPRQQVQQLFNNSGTWREGRVDLSRYAGLDNLQIRFDFSSAGTVNRNVTATGGSVPFEDSYYPANPGSLSSNNRLQNNNHEGFYIDNFIVGLAGRGEMVTSAQPDPTINAAPARQNWMPGNPPPNQVSSGPYQLEIRRGADYAANLNLTVDDIVLQQTYNLHQQMIPDLRLTTPPSPNIIDGFETGNFLTNSPTNPAVLWSGAGVKPWTITTTNINSGSYAAASGAIGDSQVSTLQASVQTSQGILTFAASTQTDTGDALAFYIDGNLATDINGSLTRYTSGNMPYTKISVPVLAGYHTFRWSYQKDNQSGNPGQVFIDDVTFPTPSVGMADLYADTSSYFRSDAQQHPSDPLRSALHISFGSGLPAGMLRIGDQNLHRAQGNIQISQNSVDSSLQNGILVDTGPRDTGTNNPYNSVRNLPTLNNDRLAPGVVLANNVVSNSGQVGILFNGDANAAVGGNLVPVAAVPFGRIINNTIFGGDTPTGVGIQVGVNAGPSILNNIIANSATGVAVDPTSINTTVIGANLFSSNTANSNLPNGSTGTQSIVVPTGTQIFRNPAARNFYPVTGSPAVDSSLNTLADRPSITAVESAVGIPESPILAPDRDQFGQLRLDDPSVSPPPGLGSNIFKDRGAVERADFTAPTASVSVVDVAGTAIVDNDPAHRDRNFVENDMAIRNTDVQNFVIQLKDVGVLIDDATARLSTQYTLTSDGVLLVDGIDYSFAYNESADQAIFRPASGIWPQNHTYKITINNSATGVLDAAGNPILPNRASGETSFSIFVGILFDFGDAPDPTYPSLLANNGARHVVIDGYHLGSTITEESDAFQSALADGDKNADLTSSDDGIQVVNLSPGVSSQIIVTAAIPSGMTGFLDAWIDLNEDGDWSDAGEKVIDHQSLHDGTQTITFHFGTAATPKAITFARFRMSSAGTNLPTGEAPDGEVEDYRVQVAGPPYQNPNGPRDLSSNALDVNNDGKVSPADALTVINLVNTYGALQLPTNLFTPQGGGPGLAFYVDVNGDTFMTAGDSLLVINYLNSQKIIGGEGEGQALAPAASDSSPAAIVPPVLYASSSVVLESRESQQPAILPNTAQVANAAPQDLALLALSSDSTASAASNSTSRPKAATDPLSDTAWDDLLTSLASDQENKHITA